MGEHAVILGAGFSRAISRAMPVTDELGDQAVALLAARGRPIAATQQGFGAGLNFENWLSLLSEEQPQLSDADNRDNAALFARLRDAIAELLLKAQNEALSRPAPAWLYDLASVLHRRRATVLTLNYDALVEAAVTGHDLWDPLVRQRVRPIDVLRGLPPLPNIGARLVGPMCNTFRLLKLHGSLDWWAVPNDLSGATLNREETDGTFEAPVELTDEERQRTLPGRERFIIPPLSLKSTYYRNPLTRELWRQADQALQRAGRISIVGYSIPPGDFVMANMLRGALSGRAVAVDLVNLDPDGPRAQLLGLGTAKDVHVFSGADCVEAFTASLRAEAAAALVLELRGSLLRDAPDAALAVAWGSPGDPGPSVRRVVELALKEDGTLRLVLGEHNPPGGATGARMPRADGVERESLPSAATMTRMIEHCKQLVACDSAGEHVLIAAWHEGRNVGASAHWIMFAPADRRSN